MFVLCNTSDIAVHGQIVREKYKFFIEYNFNIAIIFSRYKQAYSVSKFSQITSIFQPQEILNANSK